MSLRARRRSQLPSLTIARGVARPLSEKVGMGECGLSSSAPISIPNCLKRTGAGCQALFLMK